MSTPEEARAWLIEEGLLSVEDAAEAVRNQQRNAEQVERNARRTDWVGDLYRSRGSS
jgi:hypothetical protein